MTTCHDEICVVPEFVTATFAQYPPPQSEAKLKVALRAPFEIAEDRVASAPGSSWQLDPNTMKTQLLKRARVRKDMGTSFWWLAVESRPDTNGLASGARYPPRVRSAHALPRWSDARRRS